MIVITPNALYHTLTLVPAVLFNLFKFSLFWRHCVSQWKMGCDQQNQLYSRVAQNKLRIFICLVLN